jgi:hypothetical protein
MLSSLAVLQRPSSPACEINAGELSLDFAIVLIDRQRAFWSEWASRAARFARIFAFRRARAALAPESAGASGKIGCS